MADRTPRVILFEDGRSRLGPLTDLRPAWGVRVGACTVRERLENALRIGVSGGMARAAVAALAGADLPGADLETHVGEDALLVSARCALAPPGLRDLAPGRAMVEPGSGALVAARLGPGWSAGRIRVALEAGGAPEGVAVEEAPLPCLLQRPWDVIRFRDAGMAEDLAAIVRRNEDFRPDLPEGVTLIGHGFAGHLSARIFPSVVIDCSAGPVVIDEGAVIRPGAILVGPVYVGRRSIVLDRALVKANTAIGPVCKVAGEVGGTIFQGYANKAHDGHLGDSWVGEWVNLGAGTTNSNLLNTYGEVSARSGADEPRERTGLTYLGAIVGDHVKTAIGTRIMTGSVLGTGSMVATTQAAPAALAPFTWLTDAGAQGYRLEKCFEVARIAMARRGVVPSEAYGAAFAALHGRAAAMRTDRA